MYLLPFYLDIFLHIQLVCFKRIFTSLSDLKYDPPRRPREMRIINPRLIFFSVQRQMALARSFIQPERQLHFANSPN